MQGRKCQYSRLSPGAEGGIVDVARGGGRGSLAIGGAVWLAAAHVNVNRMAVLGVAVCIYRLHCITFLLPPVLGDSTL